MTMKDIYTPFNSYPNQLIDVINKPKYKDEKVKFMYVGIDEIRKAAQDLTPSGLKLYLYFVENEDQWCFKLSPKNFQLAYGVAESTYRLAKQELIDKGYIIKEDKNKFSFYSDPKNSTMQISDIIKEMNRLGGRILEYDENEYENFVEEVKGLKELEENKKKQHLLYIVSRMRKKLDELTEEKGEFFNYI